MSRIIYEAPANQGSFDTSILNFLIKFKLNLVEASLRRGDGCITSAITDTDYNLVKEFLDEREAFAIVQKKRVAK